MEVKGTYLCVFTLYAGTVSYKDTERLSYKDIEG